MWHCRLSYIYLLYKTKKYAFRKKDAPPDLYGNELLLVSLFVHVIYLTLLFLFTCAFVSTSLSFLTLKKRLNASYTIRITHLHFKVGHKIRYLIYKIYCIIMSEIFEDIRKKLVFPIDFPSQKKNEKLQAVILSIGAVLSCIIGFYAQSLFYLLVTYGIAFLIAIVAFLPAYPAYIAHKPEWVHPKIVG